MSGKIVKRMTAGFAARMVLILMVLAFMAAGAQAGGPHWAAGSGGSVPKSANPIAGGVYAVQGQIQSMAGSPVQYPGILKKGARQAQIFGQAQLYRVDKYMVFLPAAKWVKGGPGNVPPGAVEFGNDGGPLYFIRATSQGQTCYGVLPDNMGGTAYVYCGSMPQAAYSYQVLCQ